MAGHSKFKNIMFRKGAQDKKRAKIFAKLGREIQIASKQGGIDPDSNHRLRTAIDAAKAANVPKDNIERAIKKGSSNETNNLEEIKYEGFGPGSTSLIVETMTDNKNRTASNIRSIFQKYGGNLGTMGSASHNFNQIGIIKIDKKEISNDQIFELVIDSGADECISSDNFHEIHCEKNEIYSVKKNIEMKLKRK